MLTITYSNIYKKLVFIATYIFLLGFIISCGDSDNSITTSREPSEALISELGGAEYSIVLNDMNVSDLNSKKHYQHKYHILKVEKDSLIVDSLDWQTVNRDFFEKHEKDLGMEIVSHHDGTLSRVAQPVGFGWAIGNEKYGAWETTTDSTSTTSNTDNRSRWRSRGPSLLFWYWMLRRPTYRSDYTGYRTASAAGTSYYGNQGNGQTRYGTNSSYEKSKRSSFFSRKNSSSSWKSHTQEKTKRSSSRYNNSSSTRSRSGGFGK